MAQTLSVRGFTPQISKSVFLAPTACVIGDVTIGERSSVWFNVVLRGDVMPLKIGREVNIQDNTVMHGTYGKHGCTIDDRVTIGHNVTLHGCHVGEETLVGMGSIVMDEVVIGERCIVGAGSLLTPNSRFPARHLILGRPAKAVRPLTEEEIESLRLSADNYLLYKTWYEGETP